MTIDKTSRPERTWRRLAVGLTAAVLALAGCTSGAAPNPDTSKDDAEGYDPTAAVTLTWWTGQSADAETLAEQLAKEFHGRTPTSRSTSRPGRRPPTTCCRSCPPASPAAPTPTSPTPTAAGPAELGESGKTLDLTKQVADPAVGWDEFPAAAAGDGDRRTAGRSASRRSSTTSALIYNTKLFDEAGLRLPDRRLDLGRLPGRGQDAHRPGEEHLRHGVLGQRQRGHHLAPVAAAVAERRPDPRRRREAARSTPTPGVDGAGVLAPDGGRRQDASTSTRPTRSTARCSYAGHIGMIITGPWQLYDLGDRPRRRTA